MQVIAPHCLIYVFRAGTRPAQVQAQVKAQAGADRSASTSLAICWYKTGRPRNSGPPCRSLCTVSSHERTSFRLNNADEVQHDLLKDLPCWCETGMKVLVSICSIGPSAGTRPAEDKDQVAALPCRLYEFCAGTRLAQSSSYNRPLSFHLAGFPAGTRLAQE